MTAPFDARPRRDRAPAGVRSCRPAAPACCCRPRAAAPRRTPRSASRSTPERRAYVLVVDGCRPDEIDEGLTPEPPGAARRRAALPARLVDAGDGDHPQPRDDDDRRAAGPDRRARQRDLRPHARRGPRPWTGPATSRSAPSSSGSTGPATRPGTVLSKEYLYGVFGERATAPLGADARSCRSPATPPTSSRWTPRWRCSTSSTRT